MHVKWARYRFAPCEDQAHGESLLLRSVKEERSQHQCDRQKPETDHPDLERPLIFQNLLDTPTQPHVAPVLLLQPTHAPVKHHRE